MINTKYGQLPDEVLIAFVDGMIPMVWKLIPLKEDGIKTLPRYIESTLTKLIGARELIYELREQKELGYILAILESLLTQTDFIKFKSDVFTIIKLIEQLKSSIGGDV